MKLVIPGCEYHGLDYVMFECSQAAISAVVRDVMPPYWAFVKHDNCSVRSDLLLFVYPIIPVDFLDKPLPIGNDDVKAL